MEEAWPAQLELSINSAAALPHPVRVEWLTKARSMRAKLPLTSDSVDILREVREVRSTQ